ncbi:MAG TPA: maleylpyruvate isomerase N-terminal domain-containing protein [Dehalococcoidia bacterium]|nr:maleylpyruvate isomerase N-terminal domain-containing protein [Dehalococcoidia bacterium]
MNPESEALARRFEQSATEAEAEIAAIPDVRWDALCAAEGWPVAVVACHVAEGHRFIAGAIRRAAGLCEIDPLGGEDIHTINARHAREHFAVAKDEVLRASHENTAYLAGIIRALTPEQLERTRELAPGRPRLSVRQIVELAACGHIENHMQSVRAAVRGQGVTA